MQSVFSTLKRNADALKIAATETKRDYRDRLLFELRRRSNQLVSQVNPQGRRRYRLEKLVGPVGVWTQLQQYQFNILTRLGLEPRHSIVDIGCGPLTVGLELIAYLDRGNYVGVDALSEPLVEAYRRIAEHSLAAKNPSLVHSSSYGRDELGDRQFDYIWMSQLSYHLDDAQTSRLLERARATMGLQSVFLMDVLDPEMRLEAGEKWRGLSYHVRPLRFYREMANRFGLSIQARGTIRDFGYPPKINLSANILLELRRLD
jgi:precorrin-6B methylase 2